MTRLATCIMPWRRAVAHGPGGLEIFVVQRSERLATLGGFWAFAGGALDKADAHLMADDDHLALVLCGVRELFEETGLLPNDCMAAGWSKQRQDASRTRLLAHEADNAQVLVAMGLDVWAKTHSLLPLGRWHTPPFGSGRFDAHYFALDCTDADTDAASVWPGELAQGHWLTPEAALAAHESQKAFLAQPVRHTLCTLSEMTGSAHHRVVACAQKLQAEMASARYALAFAQDVVLVPQKTPTLKPHTHTNSYVLGDKTLAVVDPGAHDKAEQDKLIDYLRLQRPDSTLKAILLTHFHPDHVGGAMRLRAEFGAPIYAHRDTQKRLSNKVDIDELIEDNAIIDLKTQQWQALWTPGHAPGHLCFFEREKKHLIAGDNVLGFGTSIVMPPPDGDMQQYMASLQRLSDLDVGLLFPGHGPPCAAAKRRIDETLTQRQARERLVFDTVVGLAQRHQQATLKTLVDAVYRGLGASLKGLAELNTRAHLEKLVAEDKLVATQATPGSEWVWTAPSLGR